MVREGITDLDDGITEFFHAAEEFHNSKGESLDIYSERKVGGKGREKSTINNIENSQLIKQFDAAYLRSFYASPQQALRVVSGKEFETCHSINAVLLGGSGSPHQPESLLDALLAQPTKLKHKNSMTS